jgi:hypothetical protein
MTHTPGSRLRQSALGLPALGIVCVLALSACGGGASSASVSDTGGDVSTGNAGAPSSTAPRSQALSGADSMTGNADGTSLHAAAGEVANADPASSDVVEQKVIKNGDVSLTTSDPQQARSRVDALLTRLHGVLDDEQTVYDKQGRIHDSQLVLRVPVASFTVAMNSLEHLGKVVHSSSSGKDVTGQVIDVQQRLRTLRISLRDLNSFQSHATNINQLLRFESAITARRGEYQSLKAQRNHLLNQTSMSTINLDISVPPTQVTPVTHHHDAGFLPGLRHGWTAFTGTVVVALTAVGAVLPFALLVAAIGLPTWWWIRRRYGAHPAAAEVAAGE